MQKYTRPSRTGNELLADRWLQTAAITHKSCCIETRGGVEDIRLEVKAHDRKRTRDQGQEKKKIRGQSQGQPYQGQECSRPRTQAQVLSKKKVFRKNFQEIFRKNRFPKIFLALHKVLTTQKIVLSSSRGQANFRGLKASRPRSRTSKCVLEAKGVLEDSTSDGNKQVK